MGWWASVGGPLLAVILVCGQAFALEQPEAEDSPPPEDAVQLDRVQVAGNRSQTSSLIHATTSRTTLDREAIERFGDTNLSEILNRAPGVSVEHANGRDVIRMRGLGEAYTQVLINGQPAPPNFSLSSISAAAVDRVEIIRVPTADMSAQGIGGTINIVLSKASGRRDGVFRLGISKQARWVGKAADARFSGKWNGWLLSFSLSGDRTDRGRSLSIQEDVVRYDEALRSSFLTQRETDVYDDTLSASGSVQRALGSADELSLEFLAVERDISGISNDRTKLLSGPEPEYSASKLSFKTSRSEYGGTLGWTKYLSGYAEFGLDLTLRQSTRTSDARFIGFDIGEVLVRDRVVDSFTRDREVQFNGTYSLPFQSALALDMGWQLERDARQDRRIQNDVTPTGLEPFDLDESYDSTVLRTALYAQSEWEPTARTSIYAGLRWEQVRTRTLGDFGERTTNTAAVLSPILQAVHGIEDDDGGQIRLAVSRSFKPPQPEELTPRRFLANINSPTSPDTEGNPSLQAELAWGLDLAYERLLASGDLSVSAYSRWIDNVIVDQLFFRDQRWILTPFNVGSAHVTGLEIDWTYRFEEVWPSQPDAHFRLSLGRNWSSVSHIQGPNDYLDRQQPVVATVELVGLSLSPSIAAGMNFKYESSRAVKSSNERLFRDQSTRKVDLYVTWDASNIGTFRLAAKNLFMSNSASRTSFKSESAIFSQRQIVDTNPTLRLTFEVPL